MEGGGLGLVDEKYLRESAAWSEGALGQALGLGTLARAMEERERVLSTGDRE